MTKVTMPSALFELAFNYYDDPTTEEGWIGRLNDKGSSSKEWLKFFGDAFEKGRNMIGK